MILLCGEVAGCFSWFCSLIFAEARKGYVGGAPVALGHVAVTLCVSGVTVEGVPGLSGLIGFMGLVIGSCCLIGLGSWGHLELAAGVSLDALTVLFWLFFWV